MANFNQVVLVGRLTRDPELRYTNEGKPVCEFTLAANRKFTRKSGEAVEEVTFVDVVTWNRVAEITAEFLKKGREVLVSGSLTQDRWVDAQTQQNRSKLRVVAGTLQFLGGGSKDDAPAEGEGVVEGSPEAAEAVTAPAPVPAAVPASIPARVPAPKKAAPGPVQGKTYVRR